MRLHRNGPSPLADGKNRRKVSRADPFFYIGSFTSRGSRGIHAARMDRSSGRLYGLRAVAEAVNPSFVAAHPSEPLLYSVEERAEAAGAVRAYAADPDTGDLRFLNERPSGGRGPCHLSFDRDGRYLLVANYASGTAASLPIGAGGVLEPPVCIVGGEGSGPNAARQEGPHAHSITVDPANRFAYVADLGTDRIRIHRFRPSDGSLLPSGPAFAVLPPGSGPRHLAIRPDGRIAWAINELANTVTVLAVDPDSGALAERQTAATLPSGFRGGSIAAEICPHPSGRFLYASNRGHDSIAVFEVDGGGHLACIQHATTREIRHPRHFSLDPSGRFLIAANRDSDALVVFAVDVSSGRLSPVGRPLETSMPACVCFPPARG